MRVYVEMWLWTCDCGCGSVSGKAGLEVSMSMSGGRRTGAPRGSRTPVLTGTQAGLTSVFGMGTGVAPPLWPP